MKYRWKFSGMEDHFDTSVVFEISKFDILKFACMSLRNHENYFKNQFENFTFHR